MICKKYCKKYVFIHKNLLFQIRRYFDKADKNKDGNVKTLKIKYLIWDKLNGKGKTLKIKHSIWKKIDLNTYNSVCLFECQ